MIIISTILIKHFKPNTAYERQISKRGMRQAAEGNIYSDVHKRTTTGVAVLRHETMEELLFKLQVSTPFVKREQIR